MKSSITIAHDFLLLAAPDLDAPGIAWIAAGTILHAQVVQPGFCLPGDDRRSVDLAPAAQPARQAALKINIAS
jgi:hypothetical protein